MPTSRSSSARRPGTRSSSTTSATRGSGHHPATCRASAVSGQRMTDARAAAQNWARTWQKAWEERDVEAVVALYAPNCEYWTEPFREPYRGLDGARKYVTQS
ncbi:MAG: nuclear transport factor 2 family protein, partial [Candidatus Limnocylindria bacterium]